MIPISLLGVPLSRSSALWRMAGLSYEEAIHVHRWLGVLTMLLTTFHTLGYFVLWLQHGIEQLIEELFTAKVTINPNPDPNPNPHPHPHPRASAASTPGVSMEATSTVAAPSP